MTWLKRLLPFLLLLALATPHAALAAPLKMAAANAPAAAAAANGGLSIDLNGSGLFTDRMLQIVALITVLSIAPSIIIMMTALPKTTSGIDSAKPSPSRV